MVPEVKIKANNILCPCVIFSTQWPLTLCQVRRFTQKAVLDKILWGTATGQISHSLRAGAREALSPPEVKFHLISLHQPDLHTFSFFFLELCKNVRTWPTLNLLPEGQSAIFSYCSFHLWGEQPATRDVSFMVCPGMIWDRKLLFWDGKAVFYWVSEASYRKRVLSTIKITNGSQPYSKARNSIRIYEL